MCQEKTSLTLTLNNAMEIPGSTCGLISLIVPVLLLLDEYFNLKDHNWLGFFIYRYKLILGREINPLNPLTRDSCDQRKGREMAPPVVIDICVYTHDMMTATWRYLSQQVSKIRVNTFYTCWQKLCGTGWVWRPAVVWVIERGGVGTQGEGIEEGQIIKEENSSSFPFHTIPYDINDMGWAGKAANPENRKEGRVQYWPLPGEKQINTFTSCK